MDDGATGPAGLQSANAAGHEPVPDRAPQAANPGSRRWAIAGFLALVTALLLPWWGVTWTFDGPDVRDTVHALDPEPPLTTSWAPWITLALCAAAILLLFVRIAARSDKHEPASWRRDLGVAAGLAAAAVASALLWPAAVPSFWGGRTYSDANVTNDVTTTETAMPMLGWWLAVLAAVLLAVAWWSARPQTAK